VRDTATQISSTWNAKLKIMNTEKQLLEGKILEQTLLLEVKANAMVIVTEGLVNKEMKRLKAEPSGDTLADAYQLTKALNRLANILTESRYEVEIAAEKLENLQIDLLNLSE
jgi:hypothetical protein